MARPEDFLDLDREQPDRRLEALRLLVKARVIEGRDFRLLLTALNRLSANHLASIQTAETEQADHRLLLTALNKLSTSHLVSIRAGAAEADRLRYRIEQLEVEARALEQRVAQGEKALAALRSTVDALVG